MTEQLLEAIQFIHDAGMGHGDISGGNIAFSCSNLSNVAEEDLFEVLGLPETEQLVRLDGKPLDKGLPKHMVKAAEWDEWVDEDEEDLRVLDLGEGFFQGHEPKTLSQPGQLQAPETIFGNSFDHRVDLWRAGCMIYSFVFRRSPFWYLDDDGALVEQMVGFVEKLPEVWQPAWDRLQLNSKHQIQPMEGE
ncbi:protein kinase dsk1 [Aspergillus lentulus]|nr:protein kinase dsk1 [Aspergillus lentulus]